MKKIFLLDGHALVYRAHFSFITRPLINSKGQNTSAINGFVRNLWSLMKTEKPTHIAVAFDMSGPTFRHEMYEPYKANREAQPEDITFAIPWIVKIVEAFNIPILTKVGFEADDIIGTLAKKAEKEGYQVYMVTPDKDFGQLISENVFMYKPGRQGDEAEVWGIKEVCDNWNIKRPEQVIDILGLQGDSVDNIPGVPGIGPKTAAVLLEKFESVEGVIANVNELKGKQQESIKTYADQALLSKKLAIIDVNVPIVFDEDALEINEFDRDALAEIFKELEFRTLALQILGNALPQEQSNSTKQEAKPKEPKNTNPEQMSLFGTDDLPPIKIHETNYSIAEKNINNTAHQYFLVDTPDERAKLIELLSKAEEISFDTETTDIDPNVAQLVGMSFAIKPQEAYYVPVPADQKEAKAIVQAFKAVLEDEKIEKIGQNIKYDAIMLKWYGVEVAGKLFDTMLAHYVLEPELRHNLNYLSESYLGYAPVPIENLIGAKGKNQKSMRDVDMEMIKEYAAEDADITYQLKNALDEKLKNENLFQLFETIEVPLVYVLTDLEYEGINLDVPFLESYSKEIEVKIEALEQKIYQEAGLAFNIASPQQVGKILFDHKKIPYRWKKTKTGQYSTDEDVLSELAYENPFVADILNHRGLSKLKSTYVDALPKMVNPKTGRVHSSFNQALTSTGRLSSNNPNLQNIPIKTPEGSEVRKAFIPRDTHHVLISADYSQIELRLIAEISNEEAMLEAFIAGHDIHKATAAKVYGVALEEVSPEQRRNAKTVNFSIIYGAGAFNLSGQLGINRTEAKDLIDQYFKQYKGLKKYMDDTVAFARDKGYVMTLLGRRRILKDINSRNGAVRSGAERIAINTPIQGTAADMIKVAMNNIHKALKEQRLQSKMILQVHDELVFDVPQNEIELVKPLIIENMQNAIPNLRVPIEVGLGIGKNWLEAH